MFSLCWLGVGVTDRRIERVARIVDVIDVCIIGSKIGCEV
jgi:hypothetical protein